MNARSRPVPFKICIPSRGSARIGVAAVSYQHLQQVVRYKYKVAGEFCFQQEDGTLVCDEEYFRLLEPKTILTVIELPRPAPGECVVFVYFLRIVCAKLAASVIADALTNLLQNRCGCMLSLHIALVPN